MNAKKRYYSANEFFRNKFSDRIIKIPVDAGFTCPTRDGKISYGGCIFCSERGSGDFAGNRTKTITEQFYEMKEKMSKKWKNGKYMIYFQAFTNTYDDTETLRNKYEEAASLENVCAISVATRPDCIDDEIISLLKEINSKIYLCVEYMHVKISLNRPYACSIARLMSLGKRLFLVWKEDLNIF